MKILYYDCFSGISGDMNLAALVDLGVDFDYLKKELSKLPMNHEFELTKKRSIKNGISGLKIDVKLKSDKSHSMHHDHIHDDNHTHDHNHDDNHTHNHNHDHGDNHTHKHHDRNYKTITQMIESSELNDSVKKLSKNIFYEIAKAESKIHGEPIDEVHFHEVGAVDSIVDVVGAAICLDYLNVDKVLSSSVQVGGGFVKSAHGLIPVPAPATSEILKGVPVKFGAVSSETTTPTGAAILKATVCSYGDDKSFTIDKLGYGLGTKEFSIPNVLRVYLATDDSYEKKN